MVPTGSNMKRAGSSDSIPNEITGHSVVHDHTHIDFIFCRCVGEHELSAPSNPSVEFMPQPAPTLICVSRFLQT